MEEYNKPDLKKDSYSCPHCHAFAGMEKYEEDFKLVNNAWVPNFGMMNLDSKTRRSEDTKRINVVTCRSCKNIQVWLEDQMVYPDYSDIPYPNNDMPESVKKIYTEAADVFSKSPRAAAALLRLALQKLCVELGLQGKKIDDDIAELVRRGIPESIQEALDAVRVIGNNAVHPGEIDLDENKDIVSALFQILNFIVEKMITDKERVNNIYKFLPDGAKNAIDNRNRRTKEMR